MTTEQQNNNDNVNAVIPDFTPILQQFCQTGDKLPVPNASTPTQANMPDGFPVSESTRLSQGGQRVRREEMNGVFNLLSQFINFSSLGGKVPFKSEVAAAGGYAKNSVLFYTHPTDPTLSTYCISLVDNNTTNLNTTGPDGTNWYAISLSGITLNETSQEFYIIIPNVKADGTVVNLYIQGGKNVVPNTGWNMIINFPIAFPNKVFYAELGGSILAQSQNGNTLPITPFANSASLTQIIGAYYNSTYLGGSVSFQHGVYTWLAIGY